MPATSLGRRWARDAPELVRCEMPTESGRPHGVYRCATCGYDATKVWPADSLARRAALFAR